MDGYDAITIGHWLLFRGIAYEDVIKHELVHIQQIIRQIFRYGGPVWFYVLYVLEFLLNLTKYDSWYQAYYNISFEIEARENAKKAKT